MPKAALTLTKRLTKQEAKNVPDALGILRDEFEKTAIKDFRRYAHSDEMMGLGTGLLAKASARSLQNFVRGKTNLRYHPAAITGILAYLMYEATCGQLLDDEAAASNPTPGTEPPDTTSAELECDGKGFNSTIRSQVYRKVATVFTDSADGKAKEETPGQTLFGGAHGALFHLGELAYYQGLSRAGSGKPVKAIEAFRYVGFFDNSDNIPRITGQSSTVLENDLLRRIRYVDIVLEEGDNQESWIELKSYKAKSKKRLRELNLGPIEKWSLARQGKDKRGSAMHRQFVIDRVAENTGIAWLAKNQSPRKEVDIPVAVVNFDWRFQRFKVEKRNTTPKINDFSPDLGVKSDGTSVLGSLNKKPTSGGFGKEVLEVSLGGDVDVKKKVVLSGFADTVKTILHSLGFDLLEEATEEFILE